MGVLEERLIADGATCRLRSDGRSVADILERLEAGESPSSLCATGAITAADVVAALAVDALGDEGSAGPTLVQSSPPRPGLARRSPSRPGRNVFPRADRPSRLAIAAGLLQVHDFWDASHEAAQQADDLGERAFSAYWHGIAHRREPDAWNAGYWFRRVGRHPLFPTLGEAAHPMLDEHGDAALTSRLLSGGWDPTVMIEICSRAASGSPREPIARRLQRLEMWLLLEKTFAGLGAA